MSIFFMNCSIFAQDVALFTQNNALGINLKYEIYPLNPNQCGTFVYNRSGSTICVPPNSLERADNKPLTDVKIYYREFHNAEDIVAGDISMNAMIDGKIKTLETVGMFDIQAFDGQTPLRIKAGQKIQVRMGSMTEKTNGVRFFKYNPDKRIWNLLPNDKSINELPTSEDNVPFENVSEWNEGEDAYAWNNDFVAKLYRTAGIQEFGMHNYDYIHNCPDPIMMQAKFESSKKYPNVSVYVVYEGVNTVIYFTPDTTMTVAKETFYIENGKKFKILVVSNDIPRNTNRNKVKNPNYAVSIFNPTSINFDASKFRDKSYTFKTEPVNIQSEEELSSKLKF